MNTNVNLSESELLLVTNSDVILTKNDIINKVYELFGNVAENFKMQINSKHYKIPDEIIMLSPKIYKGEKYLNLPYVMMDYPRCFTKPDVFAIRCFFWWGNFFSIRLHLAGKFKHKHFSILMQQSLELNMHEWYVYMNEDEWKYDFCLDDYKQFEDVSSSVSMQEEIVKKSFVILSKKILLNNWQNAYEFFTKNFTELLLIFNANCLTGETNL